MIAREPGTHRTSADLPGVGRVLYTLEIPPRTDEPVPLVLALHFAFPGPKPEPYTGGRMLDSLRPGLAALNAIVIAPDSLGGRWTEPHNEAAAIALVNAAREQFRIDLKRVLITGFSRGGEGTWHIGSRHQELFTGAIPIAAPVAGGTDWRIPVYCIHAERDEVVSHHAAKTHCETLKANGARIEFHSVPDLTHYQTAAYAPHLAAGVKWMLEQWAGPFPSVAPPIQ